MQGKEREEGLSLRYTKANERPNNKQTTTGTNGKGKEVQCSNLRNRRAHDHESLFGWPFFLPECLRIQYSTGEVKFSKFFFLRFLLRERSVEISTPISSSSFATFFCPSLLLHGIIRLRNPRETHSSFSFLLLFLLWRHAN